MPNERIDLTRLRVSSFTREFLECSWEWLNDPEIKLLTDTPDFTREQQLAWYDTLESKSDYLIRGLAIDGEPAGVFGLKNISEGSGEYWGYIGNKRYWGGGVGTWMMQKAVQLAADAGVSRIYLKVLRTNVVAIMLYEKMGFNKYDMREKFDWMELVTDCRTPK